MSWPRDSVITSVNANSCDLTKLILAACGALTLTGCSLSANEVYFGRLVPPEENILRIGNGAEPRSSDPHKTAGIPENTIMMNIYEGLTTYNPRTLAPVPAMATRWESQERAKVWIFQLRKGITFSDGKPITADDFVYSWRRIIDPETASPYASLMYYVKNGPAIAEGKTRLKDASTGKFVADPQSGQDLVTSEAELKRARRIVQLQAIGEVVPVAKSDLEHAGQYQLKDSNGQIVSFAEGDAEPDTYLSKDQLEGAPALVRLADGKQLVPYTLADLGVQAVDDYTLRVEMEKPTAFFPKMTPHYAFTVVPRHVIEKYGDANWTKPRNFVGNGPFKIIEHIPYSQIVLGRNPRYWDRESVKLDKVYLIPIIEESQNANLYRAGEIDTMLSNYLPAPLIRELRQKKDYQGGPQFTTYYYDLNVRRKPFTDIRVRQALNLSVNKEDIAYKYVGRGEIPAYTFVPPGVPGYVPLPGPRYDPVKARKLLAAAGFPDGKGFPTITIYYNTLENHRNVAQAVQRMWKEQLNIKVQLQNEEWQTFQARRERRDYDVARDAWIGDYIDPSTFLDLLTEDTLNNHPGWVDPKYIRRMAEANAEPDERKRSRLLQEAEAYMIEQAPIVPIFYQALTYLKKPWVQGWYPNLLDQHPLKYVSIDRDWQKTEVARRR